MTSIHHAKRSLFRGALLLLLLTGWGLPASVEAGSTSQPAFVRLKKSATLTEFQVKLGDIAEISDSDADRLKRLSELDLATIDADAQQELTLERSFIEIRVLLAGFPAQSVVFQGPQQVKVSAPPAVDLTDLSVEQAVYDALCRQFSVPPEELRVKMVNSFVGPWIQGIGELQHPRLELLPTSQLPLGRTQLTVRILEGGRVVAARSVMFEVSRRQRVVVATSSLDRSNIVTAAHIREETRFVDGPVDQLAADQVVGRKVVIPFRPGDVVTLRHVDEPTMAESPILVQPRDAVRLVARKGNLMVTVPVAEALQAGRKGQLIRCRNVQSNQVVTGVVVERGEVHVPLP